MAFPIHVAAAESNDVCVHTVVARNIALSGAMDGVCVTANCIVNARQIEIGVDVGGGHKVFRTLTVAVYDEIASARRGQNVALCKVYVFGDVDRERAGIVWRGDLQILGVAVDV